MGRVSETSVSVFLLVVMSFAATCYGLPGRTAAGSYEDRDQHPDKAAAPIGLDLQKRAAADSRANADLSNQQSQLQTLEPDSAERQRRRATSVGPSSTTSILQNQREDQKCRTVCNFCRIVLSARWAALCYVQCYIEGREFDACLTVWSHRGDFLKTDFWEVRNDPDGNLYDDCLSMKPSSTAGVATRNDVNGASCWY